MTFDPYYGIPAEFRSTAERLDLSEFEILREIARGCHRDNAALVDFKPGDMTRYTIVLYTKTNGRGIFMGSTFGPGYWINPDIPEYHVSYVQEKFLGVGYHNCYTAIVFTMFINHFLHFYNESEEQ